MRFWVFLSVFVLSGCVDRAELRVFRLDSPTTDVRSVFVGTTRAPVPEIGFGPDRSETLSFARYDISIPPDRTVGMIDWPHRGKTDPATQFIATARDDFSGQAPFVAALSDSLKSRPKGQREAIIYVHGFNNNFADGILRIAQLAHDFEFSGVAVHYSWPSGGNPLGYEYDRDSQLFSRDGLEALLKAVDAAGAERIIIVAHSMGSLLTMETLRQIAIGKPGSVKSLVDGVILISPDIDVEVFRTQARRIGDLPDPFAIFVSQRDRALLLSGLLSGRKDRLGAISSSEDVAEFNVLVLDITAFSSGFGHFAPGTSPLLIKLLGSSRELQAAFRGDNAGRTGLLPGVVITVRSATDIILLPVTPGGL